MIPGLVGFIVLMAGLGVVYAIRKFYSRAADPENKNRSAERPTAERPMAEGRSAEGAPQTSLTDVVTGLYNLKHLLNRLEKNTSRCDRKQETMAVILWDIDRFVDFNNKFGQKEGDRLLKQVANTIRRSLRVYDEAFRSGPDEFCGILIPADEAMATEVTRRVSQIVSRDLFEGDTEYAEHEFSISSGVVFYPGDHKLPEALLHAARQELYRSRLARVRVN